VRLRFALLTLVVLIAALPAGSALGASANPADKLADQPIDDYAYDKARDCRKRPTPGALALVDWLESNAQGKPSGESCAASAGARKAPRCTQRAVRWTGISTPPARRTAVRRAA
jgi:hypothetical protein